MDNNPEFNGHPGQLAINQDFGADQPGIIGNYNTYFPTLLIRDPELLNELYVTKNKFFDKHQ